MNKHENKEPLEGHKVELLISAELLDDCYAYAPLDAPSEAKRIMMDVLMERVDKLILDHRPSHYSEASLKEQLDMIKVVRV